jgi:hypothetical protein
MHGADDQEVIAELGYLGEMMQDTFGVIGQTYTPM